MPQLQTMTGRAVATPVTVVAGSRVSLKLTPLRGEHLPFSVKIDGPGVAAIERVNNRIGANFATFALAGVAEGDGRIAVQPASGGAPLSVPIHVEAAIGLPAENSDEGTLVRLFLAEVRAPGQGYTIDDAAESMTLMRVVLENRLAKPSSRWSSAGAHSLGDVVRAPNQFAGFERYPHLSQAMSDHIQGIVDTANDASNPHQDAVRRHVQKAIDIATEARPNDPTRTGLYWWRTEGASAPGTGVVQYKTLMHNTFWREGP
jgi:hypothetical protein